MKKNIHFLSWMQAMIGGIMFFSAYHFRLAENKKEKAEESKDG